MGSIKCQEFVPISDTKKVGKVVRGSFLYVAGGLSHLGWAVRLAPGSRKDPQHCDIYNYDLYRYEYPIYEYHSCYLFLGAIDCPSCYHLLGACPSTISKAGIGPDTRLF